MDYLGHHEGSGAALFLTPEGVMRGTRVIRQLEALRWDTEFLQTWQGSILEASAEPAPCRSQRVQREDVVDGFPPPVAMAAPLPQPRVRYVTQRKLKKYGWTDGAQHAQSFR